MRSRIGLTCVFQSTLSMRRATDDDPGQRHGYRISIHALHEESDMLRESEAYGPSSFQSTLSMRRATRAAAMGRGQAHFNPRSP